MVEFERTVNYYETDQMGIVHHSNYIRWFEEARLHFMEEVGLPYQLFEDAGILIIVLGTDCKYINAVHWGEDVIIKTKVTALSAVKMSVGYEVYEKKTMKLCATGSTSHAFVTKQLKPVRLKRDYQELYEKVQTAFCVEK